MAFDVARTSVRDGAKKATMICLEARDEQTADEFEIEDGREEGVTIINRVAPVTVERGSHGKITGVRVKKIYSLYDYTGRFAPNSVPESEYVIPCNTAALWIGQSMDTNFLDGWNKRDQLIPDRGILKTEKDTGRTSVKGVCAGGDAAFGAALFITGIRPRAGSSTVDRFRFARHETLPGVCRGVHGDFSDA